MTSVVLGVIIAACAILKNLTDDYSTFWSYIGVGLAIVVAVGAWLEVQDAGGMDSLKAEASSYGGSSPDSGTAAAAAPAAAAPAAAAAEAEPQAMQDAGESAASEASEAASEAGDAASDAADAASDAVSDEPSNEQST
jgi:hypothetical protein